MRRVSIFSVACGNFEVRAVETNPSDHLFPKASTHFVLIIMRRNRSRSHSGPPKSPVWTVPSATAQQAWKEYSKEESTDDDTIQKSFIRHATKTLARSSFNMDDFAAYQATAHRFVSCSLVVLWRLLRPSLHHSEPTNPTPNPNRVVCATISSTGGTQLSIVIV